MSVDLEVSVVEWRPKHTQVVFGSNVRAPNAPLGALPVSPVGPARPWWGGTLGRLKAATGSLQGGDDGPGGFHQWQECALGDGRGRGIYFIATTEGASFLS